jgi:ketosteroid isomerase-like protein
MIQQDQANHVADRLGAAISARDADLIRAVYADDIVVWHPAFDQEMGKVENSGLLAKVFEITSELLYENIRRHPIADGVIQQHVLNGKFADGSPLPSLQVCMIIKVRDDKIVRIEEYFDSGTFASVWERLAAIA